MKYGEHKNGFFLPNELFQLGLDYGELAVYSFLKRCENRKTHQCWPSIRTIGEAVGMSENTVRKYIRRLEERELITTEPTEVITKSSGRRNGNLLFTLRPIGEVIDDHYASQLAQLDLAAERQRVAKLLQKQENPAGPPVGRCVAFWRPGKHPCTRKQESTVFRPCGGNLIREVIGGSRLRQKVNRGGDFGAG